MNHDSPFITIFTPNYNNKDFLPEAIESILNQTYSNFEYLIIDDGSIDGSWEIIQKYANKDNRVKAYRNDKNLKIVKTRNRGFKLSSSKAKYFAILDSDDVAILNRLEFQVDFLENNPAYALVGSNKYLINQDSQLIGYRNYPLSDEEIKKVITRYNPIAQSSVLIRKKVIEEIGFYDQEWKFCQDYDYWLRIGRYWKLRNLRYPLIKYRISEEQVKSKNMAETIKMTYRIQEKAITKYGYPDNIYNKIYRIILRLSLFYPRLINLLYKIKYIKD